MDRSMLRTVAMPAIKDYLYHIHIYKSIGDSEGAKEYFTNMTIPDPEILSLRDIMLAKKSPRRLNL